MKISVPTVKRGWNLEQGVRAQPRETQRRARPLPQVGTRRRRKAGAAGPTARQVQRASEGKAGLGGPRWPASPPRAPPEAENGVQSGRRRPASAAGQPALASLARSGRASGP